MTPTGISALTRLSDKLFDSFNYVDEKSLQLMYSNSEVSAQTEEDF